MTVSTVSIFRREQYKQIAILKVFVLTEYIINSIKSSINSMNTVHFTLTEQNYQYSFIYFITFIVMQKQWISSVSSTIV